MSNWTHDVVNNSEEHREFAHALGYAILNCGDIELFTYSFAAALTRSHVFGTGLARMSFAERKKRICDLLSDASIADRLRMRAQALWDEAVDVMRWRNILAHNPVTVMWINREDGSREEHVAVFDMQSCTPERTNQLQLEELKNVINRAQGITHRLSVCLSQLQQELEKSAMELK